MFLLMNLYYVLFCSDYYILRAIPPFPLAASNNKKVMVECIKKKSTHVMSDVQRQAQIACLLAIVSY